jgi:NAD-specific glutamate dehydrogenase
VVGPLSQVAALSTVGEAGWVHRASGRPLPDVIGALGAVADRLGLGSLGRALQAARPADRWDRAQAHLLADDLAREASVVAAAALSSHPGLDGPASVAAYLAHRPAAVARYQARALLVPPAGAVNLSLVALVSRSLAHLAGSGPEAVARDGAGTTLLSD